MQLRVRLVLFIGLASLIPLGLLGLGATRAASRMLLSEVSSLQGSAADGLAVYVDTWLGLQFRLLSMQVETFAVERLGDRERASYLRLVYRQTPEVHIVSLTSLDGVDVTPSLYLGQGDEGLMDGRDGVDDTRFAAFRAGLPLARVRAAVAAAPDGVDLQPVSGRPYLPLGRGVPVLPVAVVVPAGSLVLGVELGLDPIAERVAHQTGNSRDVAVIGPDGELIVSAGGSGLVDPEVFKAFIGGAPGEDIRYETADGREVVAACSPVPRMQWLVVVAEPIEVSTAVVSEIRGRTGFIAGVAALLSLVFGIGFAQQLSGPVVELKNAALAVAEGDLGRRVNPQGKDELAELTRAFNFMSTRLQRNAAEIEAKNEEIRAFNRELQQRVDERTAELREAQDRLVRSARLAAVGEMGSGLAHELNNPIAGILGLAQVLLARETGGTTGTLLRSIEEQALRCKGIIGQLLGFSRDPATEGDVDPVKRDVVDLSEVMSDVLALVGGPFRARDIEVVHRESAPLNASVDRAEMGRAFAQLLTSLRSALPRGGRLTIEGAPAPGGAVRLDLHLEGPVLVVGGDDWMASGMGLWAARTAITAHGGEFEEPDIPADATDVRAATWRILLPRA